MAKNKNKLSGMGQAVKGCLATFLAPRLAADGKLKPGELDALVKNITGDKYPSQIVGIVGTVKDRFAKRFAADADLEDLPEILEALKSAAEAEEAEEEEEEDAYDKKATGMDEDEDEDGACDGTPGEKLVKMLTNPAYGIPPEDLEMMNGLINALSAPKAKDGDEPSGEFPDKEKGAAMPKPELTPQALDAAINKSQKDLTKSIADRFQAAQDCASVIGAVAPMSFDSANDIYKLALDQKGIDTKDVNPGAFRSLFMSMNKPAEAAKAQDAKGLAALTEKYPNAPRSV